MSVRMSFVLSNDLLEDCQQVPAFETFFVDTNTEFLMISTTGSPLEIHNLHIIPSFFSQHYRSIDTAQSYRDHTGRFLQRRRDENLPCPERRQRSLYGQREGWAEVLDPVF